MPGSAGGTARGKVARLTAVPVASETDALPGPPPRPIDLPQQLGMGVRVGPEGVLGGGEAAAHRGSPIRLHQPRPRGSRRRGQSAWPQYSSSGDPRAHAGLCPHPFITCASPGPPSRRAGVSRGLSWLPASSLCPCLLTRPSPTVFPVEAQQNGAPPGPGEAAAGAVMEASAALPAQNPSTSGYLWASGRSLSLPGPIRGVRPLEGAWENEGLLGDLAAPSLRRAQG